jgi:glycosyltransferase involved in cell wall biosynthesis
MLGNIPYSQYVAVMQLSSVHVYLTYPFVLSWSLLEAMSLGCAIVAGDTQPVREAVDRDRTGRLVDFFDVAGLVETVTDLLRHPSERRRLGANARQAAVENYDLNDKCLPAQLKWVEGLFN